MRIKMWGYIIWECILWGYKMGGYIMGRYIICRLMFIWELLFKAQMLAMLGLMMKDEKPITWAVQSPNKGGLGLEFSRGLGVRGGAFRLS